MSQRQRVLIDTDAGVDDAVAIALILGDPRFDVVGISTTDGNCRAPQAAVNVRRVLDCAGKVHIPVAVGRPLAGSLPRSPHGRDGFGDTGFASGDSAKLPVCDTEAAELIVQLGRDFEGQISLLALGPLTNLAAALALDPSALGRFRQVTVSGGMGLDDLADAVAQRYPEYLSKGDTNTSLNPRAAAEVTRSEANFVWVGMNVTGLIRIPLSRAFAGESAGALESLLRAIHSKYAEHCTHYYRTPEPVVTSHDAVAAALLTNPELIVDAQFGHPGVVMESGQRAAVWARRDTCSRGRHLFVTAVDEQRVTHHIAAAFVSAHRE